MDLLSIAIRNARIDAQARAKRLQTQARGRDPTRRERAKAANILDCVQGLRAQRCSHSRHVTFGAFEPARFVLKQPRQGILKR